MMKNKKVLSRKNTGRRNIIFGLTFVLLVGGLGTYLVFRGNAATVNQDKYTDQLDLSKYKYSSTPYTEDAKPEGRLSVLNNPQRVRTYIFGQAPYNSRNGGSYAYDISPHDELYAAYDVKFDSNFVMKDGGKMGLNIAAVVAGKNGLSGGGKFDQGMSFERLIFEQESGKIGIKTYVYTWFFGSSKTNGAYMTVEDAKVFGGCSDSEIRFGSSGSCSVRWNDIAIGGNRATNNARYTGVSAQLKSNGTPITFSPGEKVTIETRFKMNTFTNQSINAYGTTVKVPNHDGIYEVWVNGVLGVRQTGMVFASPRYPTMSWNEFQVGASAGGPFEGMYGGVEISNVRYGSGSTVSTPPPAPTPPPTPTTQPDLVVTDISWSPTNPKIGEPVTLSATIKNQGSSSTPADVIHGVGFSISGSKRIWSDDTTAALAAGASRTVTANGGLDGATWTPTAAGSFQVMADVDDVDRITGESNESNNTRTETISVVSAPTPPPPVIEAEDINQDGLVNLQDFSILATNFGKSSGLTNPRADINQDGTVNLQDFSLLAGKFGS